jgi:hypothetical protein
VPKKFYQRIKTKKANFLLLDFLFSEELYEPVAAAASTAPKESLKTPKTAETSKATETPKTAETSKTTTTTPLTIESPTPAKAFLTQPEEEGAESRSNSAMAAAVSQRGQR